jgi:chromate transporter
LPSFIFILAGGPWVESTRGQLRFTAPLAAVTAAVVGVIANLALFFLAAVAWPQAHGVLSFYLLQSRPDGVALALAGFAALALWRLKWSVMRVIAVSALLGLALRWLGLA